jgi:hypothetical protein
MSDNKLAKGSLTRRASGWWVVDLPCGDMGPYKTRAEADEDRKGVERFYRTELKSERASARKKDHSNEDPATEGQAAEGPQAQAAEAVVAVEGASS